MNKPRIGVIGGMGPAATILLQQRILDAVPVQSDDGHIPLLVDMNPQVPSRIEYLLHERGINPGPVLANMARNLQQSGVDAIAMPCCTAHHFAADIENSVTIPFLNMVELTSNRIAQLVPKNSTVGILASPATEKTGLFRDSLVQHGLTALYPENKGSILAGIEAIKQKGETCQVLETIHSAMNELQTKGVAAFIIGCSEFSLLSRKLKSGKPVVDAMDVLTHSIADLPPNTGQLET